MIKPILSIVIVSYNTADLTCDCIKSVIRDKKLDFELTSVDSKSLIPTEIIVVDNNSSDGSAKKIREKFPRVRLIENQENKGFGAGNNQGIREAKGNYLLLLNSDTVVLHGAISQALDWLSGHPETGICTAQLLNQDKTIQATGGFFPNIPNIFTWATGLDDLPLINDIIKPLHPHTPDFYLRDKFYCKDRKIDWITGAFMLARKEVVGGVNGFDENYFMYGEEVEMIYRIRKKYPKYDCWYLVGPQVIHLGGRSSSNKAYPIVKEIAGIKEFFRKHRPEQYRIINLILKINPSIRLRGWFFKILGNKEKAAYFSEICSKI